MVRKPVKPGDVIELEIVLKGLKGDGIGRIENFLIIIPDSKLGDVVKAKVTKVNSNCAFAKLIKNVEGKNTGQIL